MNGYKNWLPDTPSFIALVMVSAIVVLPYALLATGKTDTDVFKILVGALLSVGLTNIVGFYFGSSSSSKSKDATIATMAGTAETAGGKLPSTTVVHAEAPSA